MAERMWHGAVIVAIVAMAGAVLADSVTLDSGKTIEGTIVNESESAIQINVSGTLLSIPRGKVKTINKEAGPTTDTLSLARLAEMEAKSDWPALYEAATEIVRRDPKNAEAAKKQKLAEAKLRESLGGKEGDELVRQRKFTEAIDLLDKRLRKSGLLARGAGAVGRRALAELYLGSAETRMRNSTDGHVPFAEARKARELDPATPGLDYIEGWAQMQLLNFGQAVPLLERAAAADPKNFGIRLMLLRCYQQMKDYGKIVQVCEVAPEEMTASAERWPEIREILAEAYRQVALRFADQRTTEPAAAAYEKHLGFVERTSEHLRAGEEFFERIGDGERAKALRTERLWGRKSPSKVSPPTTGTVMR